MKKRVLAIICVIVATVGFKAAAQVDSVTVEQDSVTRLVTVNYETALAGITTFQIKTGGVDVVHAESVSSITGAINQYLPDGEHTFYWQAWHDLPDQNLSDLTVEVTLWSTDNPPEFCDIYLVPTNGKLPIFWYANESEVPFGVTAGRWKKDHLLLKKIPSSDGRGVTLGSPPAEPDRGEDEDLLTVTITQPFYMGVYEVTQRQWENIFGTRISYFTNAEAWAARPVERVSYCLIRESGGNTQSAEYSWPDSGYAVHPDSFMGVLRDKTDHQLLFDLPTETQWEYACRAGTTAAWNSGSLNTSTTKAETSLNLLGRYNYNGGLVSGITLPSRSVADTQATAQVGAYLPNAWGLYDMHGNVREWCLDWYGSRMLEGADPVGASSGSERVHRGGGMASASASCRSAHRTSLAPTDSDSNIGFRIVAPAVFAAAIE